MLDLFPSLKKSLDYAVNQEKLSGERIAGAKRRINQLRHPKLAIQKVLDGNPDKAIENIIGSGQPRTLALRVRKLASRDKTGQAVKGL